VNFLFDRNMPLRLARMMDLLESNHTIRHHNDDARFHERTTDVEWIYCSGKRSADARTYDVGGGSDR
jgi:hypothetical protein